MLVNGRVISFLLIICFILDNKHLMCSLILLLRGFLHKKTIFKGKIVVKCSSQRFDHVEPCTESCTGGNKHISMLQLFFNSKWCRVQERYVMVGLWYKWYKIKRVRVNNNANKNLSNKVTKQYIFWNILQIAVKNEIMFELK